MIWTSYSVYQVLICYFRRTAQPSILGELKGREWGREREVLHWSLPTLINHTICLHCSLLIFFFKQKVLFLYSLQYLRKNYLYIATIISCFSSKGRGVRRLLLKSCNCQHAVIIGGQQPTLSAYAPLSVVRSSNTCRQTLILFVQHVCNTRDFKCNVNITKLCQISNVKMLFSQHKKH